VTVELVLILLECVEVVDDDGQGPGREKGGEVK
jgi:hypothetical protein